MASLAAVLSTVLVLAQGQPFPAQAADLASPQAQASAQPPAQAPSSAEKTDEANTVEGVVVEGRRKLTEDEQRKAVSAFVRQLSEPTVRGRLARWETEVCPGVVGLPPDRGAYILDRFAEEATALGVEVGRPGCRPDVLIVVAGRPDEFAAKFRKEHRRFFAHLSFPGDVEAGGGDQNLDEFLTTTRPVRWWHVARKEHREILEASRLSSNVREDLSRALVIVDGGKLQGITTEQLAGYLAMTMLAQLAPEAAPTAFPTIMTLFNDREAGRPPPETLTQWDRAYLKGLYEADAHASSLHTQRGAIRRSLNEARKPN